MLRVLVGGWGADYGKIFGRNSFQNYITNLVCFGIILVIIYARMVQTDRETLTQTHRQTHTDRHRQTHTETQTDTDTQTHAQTHRHPRFDPNIFSQNLTEYKNTITVQTKNFVKRE